MCGPRKLGFVAWAGFLSFILSACHGGMRLHAYPDAGDGAEVSAPMAPSEDAVSTGRSADTRIPDEDTEFVDATVSGDSVPVDGNVHVEVARIVREGTNFGSVTVVVYSDASAVRTKEGTLTVQILNDAASEPSVEVLPPGSPEVVRLLEDLARVDDVSVLGGWNVQCPGQSVSFSTRTYLTAGGKTSHNLESDEGAMATAPA